MELPSHPVHVPGPGASSGFSLVELLVTILIATILMGVAVPMMTSAIAGNRLSSQTNEIVSALTLARSQAITQNQQVTFCRTASNESVANPTCAGSTGAWNYWIVRTNSGTVVRRGTKVGSSVTIRSALAGDQVRFGSDGLARTNSNALITGATHITICSNHSNTNNKRQITLGAGSRLSTAIASGATCP